MNAQEAIKAAEEFLNDYFEECGDPEHPYIAKADKALSIVLESAKLLHADEIDPATNAGGGIVVERFVQKEDYERLGIEVTDS